MSWPTFYKKGATLQELATKAKLAAAAQSLALSYELVQHNSHTYMPAHWATLTPGPCDPAEQVWIPLTRDDKRRMGNQQFNILFASDAELTNFDLMIRQFATECRSTSPELLVKTEDALMMIAADGSLQVPSGKFLPNFIKHQINNDPSDKAEVFSVISEWLGSDEDAISLLRHISTALSPGWSAVKYIIFIGEGRNGKSILMSMINDLFGIENISFVTRQQMSERLPVCVELNGKLVNIVFDGEMTYIKDSSMEKTLIAGEPASVRMLYENGNTLVQTKALFFESLNKEPKTRDKSSALQKRLSRFFFEKVYEIDMAFEARMRSEKMIGAFLALLLDHFVQQSEVAEKLKQTQKAASLQVEQQLLNSPLLQFIQHLVSSDPMWIDKLMKGGPSIDALAGSFMAWRVTEGYTEYSTADVHRMFKEQFGTTRKSKREGSKVIKQEVIAFPKSEAEALLNHLKGDIEDGLLDETVVAD